MSISKDQRREELLRELPDGVKIIKARNKYDRRHKMLVVQDDDQILREFPLGQILEATAFAAGYQMGKAVWS